MADLKDLEKMFGELTSKIEEKFKTPEDRRKYQEALNSPEVKQKVDESMKTIRDLLK